MGARRGAVRWGAGVVVAATGVVAIWLGVLERAGPARASLSIGNGIPATLYVPVEADGGGLAYQRPRGDRPPVVVLAHGYGADQALMSPMARSLADAGYAVVTFDFRGHGANTDRFEGDLTRDLAAVVDWAESSPLVDGRRLAVVGHSMGAGVVLDFATQDGRPRAVVPISGGRQLYDEVVPPNVLLMAAAGDPRRVRDRQAEIADDLADTGAQVTTRTIAGRDHLTILWSGAAIDEIVRFLDPVMDVERTSDPPGLEDPRLPVAVLYALLAVVVVGLLGLLTARFVEVAEVVETVEGVEAVEPPALAAAPREERSSLVGALALIAGALLATTPVMAAGGIDVLPLGAGQPVLVQALLAAGVLWLVRASVRRDLVGGRLAAWTGDGPWWPSRSLVLPGIAGGVGVFVLFLPLGGVTHRLVPTPERLVLWVIVTVMALPFFAAFEALVRRGGTWRAVGRGLLGRLVLVVAVVAGLALGLLPAVVGLVLPLLVGIYLLLEAFAATCYARGHAPGLIAITESIVVAWLAVTLTPIG